jgi:hypothetical protein
VSLFIRKSFGGLGPVRLNLSKSGLGVSAGIKGARIGVGPRGAYVHAGRGGLYYRKQLSTGSRSERRSVDSSKSAPIPNVPRSAPPPLRADPGGYGAAGLLGIVSVVILTICLSRFSVGLLLLGVFLLGASIVVGVKQKRRIAWFGSHRALLTGLSAAPDGSAISALELSIQAAEFNLSVWSREHETIYRKVLTEVLAGGVTAEERHWLDAVAKALRIRDTDTLDADVIGELLWELMEDGEVSEEEEAHARQVVRALGLSADDVSDELSALEQFVRVRKFRQTGLPTIDPGINLQKNEQCHHMTKGALLNKRVLRSYTRGGQRYKEEGLEVAKEGDIYVTSKRILIVSDGTSSIPHEKILDIEVDQDDKLIEVTKDGRQKPLYIRVPDAIYTGALIETLSESSA